MASSTSMQIVAYLKRHPSMTLEQFHKHWQDNHAPIVAPWAKKHGILGYCQIHASGTIVPTDETGAADPDGPVAYDGIATFELDSIETLHLAFADPYYLETIKPDEDRFLDRSAVGHGVLMRHQGKLVKVLDHGDIVLGK